MASKIPGWLDINSILMLLKLNGKCSETSPIQSLKLGILDKSYVEGDGVVVVLVVVVTLGFSFCKSIYSFNLDWLIDPHHLVNHTLYLNCFVWMGFKIKPGTREKLLSDSLTLTHFNKRK